MSRQHQALTEPGNLDGFPTIALSGMWFRAHSTGLGPWWFSSDQSGRFDLTAPHGTCYFGSNINVAVRERLGARLASGPVPAAVADQMVVSRARLRSHVADFAHRAAATFGITREVGALTPYELPQRWARALHQEGHRGIRYWPRFAVAAGDLAVALFGSSGVGTRRGDPGPIDGREAMRAAGIPVFGVPRSLPTIQPPRG